MLPSSSKLAPHVSGVSPGRQRLHLDAVFNGPRGRPTGVVGTAGIELDEEQPVGRPAPNVLRFTLRWPPTVERARIEIGPPGEALDLVKLVVRGEEGNALAVIGCATGEAEAPTFLPDTADWEELTNTLDPVGYLESLEGKLEALALEPGELLSARQYFAHLDRETNPFLLAGMTRLGRIYREDADQRRLAIESIGNELRVRVRLRCRGLSANEEACPSLDERIFDHLRGKCRAVSRLVLGVIDQHFEGDLGAFERAFTLFANGDLRLELPSLAVTTQPSSANFFLFGELALMAFDYGIDKDRWWSLANVTVRSQRIFGRVYAPASVEGADFFSYSGRDYARTGTPFTEEEIRRLRDEFEGADLHLEAAKHAALSMPGLRA